MKNEIHLLKVDTVCHHCGYRNQGEYKLPEKMDIICCGKCGKILANPEEMTENDKEQVELCVKEAMKDEEDGEDVLL